MNEEEGVTVNVDKVVAVDELAVKLGEIVVIREEQVVAATEGSVGTAIEVDGTEFVDIVVSCCLHIAYKFIVTINAMLI